MSVLIGGIVAYLALLFVLVLTQDAALFPALLLVGALTVPLTVLLWASNGPRGELLPSGIILVTALVGGVVGILVAAICESIAAAVLGDSMLLLVGLIEETAKLIVPLIILAVAYPRTAQGGVVIGVAAGAGFAVLENILFLNRFPDLDTGTWLVRGLALASRMKTAVPAAGISLRAIQSSSSPNLWV